MAKSAESEVDQVRIPVIGKVAFSCKWGHARMNEM
jgi:hypothetical protein